MSAKRTFYDTFEDEVVRGIYDDELMDRAMTVARGNRRIARSFYACVRLAYLEMHALAAAAEEACREEESRGDARARGSAARLRPEQFDVCWRCHEPAYGRVLCRPCREDAERGRLGPETALDSAREIATLASTAVEEIHAVAERLTASVAKVASPADELETDGYMTGADVLRVAQQAAEDCLQEVLDRTDGLAERIFDRILEEADAATDRRTRVFGRGRTGPDDLLVH